MVNRSHTVGLLSVGCGGRSSSDSGLYKDRCSLGRFLFAPTSVCQSIRILRLRFLHVLPKRKEVHGLAEQERDEEYPPDDEYLSVKSCVQLFPPAQVRRCSYPSCERHEDYSCHYPGET